MDMKSKKGEGNQRSKRRGVILFLEILTFALSILIGCTVFPRLPKSGILKNDSLRLAIGIIGLAVLWGTVIFENLKSSTHDK